MRCVVCGLWVDERLGRLVPRGQFAVEEGLAGSWFMATVLPTALACPLSMIHR